ncbi:MAG: NAD(P)H-hydrate dehydratase [Spirochaetes bacterium]|nr:NAD(P)H-hydrate dehydratase [Spirochaetota bacterium]
MKVVTAEQMRKIDSIAIEELGIPGEVLMGYAGKSIADYIISSFMSVKKIAVFCGTGNNGGDGFVAAYFLFNKSYYVDIFIAGDIKKVSNTSNIYLNICKNSDINITLLDDQTIENIDLGKYGLIVDALLGTGFKGSPRGIFKDSIAKINNSGVKILSVDLPSGLPSDGEAPEGEVVKADYTVTMGLPKISLVTYPGKQYTGILQISDIGFPVRLSNSPGLPIDLLDSDYVRIRLSLLKDADSHKGTAGHVLLIGGFDGMEGAIIMSAVSAFETGAGLATLLTTNQARNIIAGQIPELMTRTLDSLNLQTQEKNIQKNIIEDINKFFKESRHFDSMIIGPGMGRTEISSYIFNSIINKLKDSGIKKVLIDGDGLFHLSVYLKFNPLPGNISYLLSPHFNEASKLLEKPVDEIKKNRLFYAKELAKKTSAIVLLKGPATIITDGNNSLINTTGNPALGTAGSGDVLSGITGALLLKDISPFNAAGIGAYIHGLAGDMCVEKSKVPVLKATDIINNVRAALDKSTK